MVEKRVSPRSRTLLKAEIELSGSRLPCLVRDLTETGARLSVSEAVLLPDNFQIKLPRHRQWLPAQLRWRRGDGAGVTFKRDLSATMHATLQSDHVRALEQEVIRLRRILDELREDPSRLHAILEADAA